MKLSSAEAGYIAGLIDGEGSIVICSQGKDQRKNKRFDLRITMGMTHPGALNFLQQLVGGRIRLDETRRNPRHKPVFRWGLTRRKEVKELLLLLLPYLIVKREQAQLALQFIELGERRCPSVRAEFHGNMLRLNFRGTGNKTVISPMPVTNLQ